MALVDRVHSHFAAGPQVRTSQPMAILRNTSYIRHACQRKLVDFIGLTVVRADRIISRAAQSHSSPVHHPDAVPSALDIDEGNIVTRFIAETLLPTKHGKFRLRGYKHSIDAGSTFSEPTAIISGVVEGMEEVPVRVHDACYTSEVLGSLKCDCAEQLALALELIHNHPPGMVIYLQQEGRGIGLANKIAAYSLQEKGLDTVDANRALGLPDDCREYYSVRNILSDLGVKSIRLITNNPRKINKLTALGITITGRIPSVVEAGEYNQGYLETKRDRMDHMLEEEPLEGQYCLWDHDSMDIWRTRDSSGPRPGPGPGPGPEHQS